MINDILDLAKLEAGKMEVRPSEFRIDTVVHAQCDMVRSLAEDKNIDLAVEVDRNLPAVYQDQAKVQQILTNLLSNAIKFTPEGGRVDVFAGHDSSGKLLLTVTDTGVGIAEEDRDIIFEKFRQSGSILGEDGLEPRVLGHRSRPVHPQGTLQVAAGRDQFRERTGARQQVHGRAALGRRRSLAARKPDQRAAARSGGAQRGRVQRRAGRQAGRPPARWQRTPPPSRRPPVPMSHDRMAMTQDGKRAQVHLFTDGACSGNPGPGGWAFILRHVATGQEKEASGGERDTTNNRMELLAVIRGLEALKRPCHVELFTDSVYVGKGLKEWLPKWKQNGWRRREGQRWMPVKNDELWRRLDELAQRHTDQIHARRRPQRPSGKRTLRRTGRRRLPTRLGR